MGCIRLGSSSSYDKKPYYVPDKLPNPDPSNFKIVDFVGIGEFLIVKANYPDCNNYEGNKILMYKGVSIEQLMKQKTLDPHFSKSKKFHSPVARFEPTKKGWEMAERLAYSYLFR